MKDIFLTRTLIGIAFLFSSCLVADEANVEYKIKAAYLYNFTKFITWPAINGATFNLCILGRDPFGTVIDPIEEKTAFARTIKIFRLNEADFLSTSTVAPDCYILYVNEANSQKMVFEKIQATPHKPGTLIVGEGEAFAAEGGMIGFVNRNGKIKLQINLQAVNQTSLKISAKLLEVAELIKEESHD